jgi:hypothetical protein
LTGDVYGRLLDGVQDISGSTPPDATMCVTFDASANNDGTVIASWHYYGGWITVCTMDLTSQLGTPVPDRLFINLARYARAKSASLQPLPSNYQNDVSHLGIFE